MSAIRTDPCQVRLRTSTRAHLHRGCAAVNARIAALREQGLNGSLSLLISGALVLIVVLALVQASTWLRQWLHERRELMRARLNTMTTSWISRPQIRG